MEFAKNASRLHRKIGEILLLTSPFNQYQTRQEVLVSELFPAYPNNRDKYDWVVPDMHLIIEGNGSQHYSPATFGSSAEQAIMNFQSQKFRDGQKEEIAIMNGWTFITVPFLDEKNLTSDYLSNAYKLAFDPSAVPIVVVEKVEVKPSWLIEKQESMKQKAKLYRRQQYELQKKRLKDGIK
jgi:hypothetical protein